MSPEDYLKQPYQRRIVPDESGGYVATIEEFPGLVAQGETPEEAYANLEAAALAWLDTAIDIDAPIPEPAQTYAFSGKFPLRLPKSLHCRIAAQAKADHTSLNQWIVAAAAYYLGVKESQRHSSEVGYEIAQSAVVRGFETVIAVVEGVKAILPDSPEYQTTEAGGQNWFHRNEGRLQ